MDAVHKGKKLIVPEPLIEELVKAQVGHDIVPIVVSGLGVTTIGLVADILVTVPKPPIFIHVQKDIVKIQPFNKLAVVFQ